MNFDIKTFVMGSLTGLTFGLGIADLVDKDLSQFMSGMGSILAGMGAVLTAYVAYMVYKQWYRQHDYMLVQKIDRDIKDKASSVIEKVMNLAALYAESKFTMENGTEIKLLLFKVKDGLVEIEDLYLELSKYLPIQHIHHIEIMQNLSECNFVFRNVINTIDLATTGNADENMRFIFDKVTPFIVHLRTATGLISQDTVYVFKS